MNSLPQWLASTFDFSFAVSVHTSELFMRSLSVAKASRGLIKTCERYELASEWEEESSVITRWSAVRGRHARMVHEFAWNFRQSLDDARQAYGSWLRQRRTAALKARKRGSCLAYHIVEVGSCWKASA